MTKLGARLPQQANARKTTELLALTTRNLGICCGGVLVEKDLDGSPSTVHDAYNPIVTNTSPDSNAIRRTSMYSALSLSIHVGKRLNSTSLSNAAPLGMHGRLYWREQR